MLSGIEIFKFFVSDHLNKHKDLVPFSAAFQRQIGKNVKAMESSVFFLREVYLKFKGFN